MSKPIPAGSMKKAIAYLHLLSFCPPDKLADFKRNTTPMLKEMAERSGLKEKVFLAEALPEACRLIVAFHQARREPDADLVKTLENSARGADKNPKSLAAFKEQMDRVAALPGRAKLENRLHRNKGCRLCAAPCQYGYFTLVSDPQFSLLQKNFTEEAGKPASKQTPLMPVYAFTVDHLLSISGTEKGFCEKNHLGNLAFCLLMLSMAKSRLAFPEAQTRIFQEANQAFISRQGG